VAIGGWGGCNKIEAIEKLFPFLFCSKFRSPGIFEFTNKYGAGRGKGQFEFTFLDVEVTATTRVSALVSAIIYYVPVWLLE